MTKTKEYFAVDAGTVLALGRESIKDPATAVLELIKNSYDADARLVEVIIDTTQKKLILMDDGMGMSEETMRGSWLRIGYSDKVSDPFSPSGRRRTGEKGVGRLAANLLGDLLKIRSVSEGNQAKELTVDWRKFQRSQDLAKIPVEMKDAKTVQIPVMTTDDASALKDRTTDAVTDGRTGTCIEIGALREDWAVIAGRLHEAISWLVPPTQTSSDFQVRFYSDAPTVPNGVVVSEFAEAALIKGVFEISADGETKSNIDYRGRDAVNITTAWAAFVDQEKAPAHSFGPASITLWYYPRTRETVAGTGRTIAQLGEFLDVNSGIRVYRDGIRVRQYGEPDTPEHDWLNLGPRKTSNPVGKRSRGYRVAPSQMVGILTLSRDGNPGLRDTTAREGFVQNAEFNSLKAWIIACVVQIELEQHRVALEGADIPPALSPHQKMGDLQNDIERFRDETLDTIRESIMVAKVRVPKKAAKVLDRIDDGLSLLADELASATTWVQEVLDENVMLRGLATIGIAATSFSHETRNSLSKISIPMTNAAKALEMYAPEQTDIISALTDARGSLKTAQEWSKFALGRIAKDKRKRRKARVDDIVDALLSDMNAMFRASGISLIKRLDKVSSRVFAVDIESILINLITNAVYFVKRPQAARKIEVSLSVQVRDGTPGYWLEVSDSGDGVAPRDFANIWKPLFSTKTKSPGVDVGTGLGLYIVDSIVRSMNGVRDVSRSPSLGGASFRIWMPVVK